MRTSTLLCRIYYLINLFIDTTRIVCCRVYVTVWRPSVCLCPTSHLLTAVAACGGFAAVGPAGGGHRSIAARRVCSRRGRLSIRICSGATGSSTAVSSKCEQCHVVSWRRKLNTDLFL